MSEQSMFKKTQNGMGNEPEAVGAMDSGVRSLMRSLRFAFLTLVVIIIGTTIYFFSLGGYIAVPPQEAVIVLRFGAYHDTYTRGPRWFFPYPVNQFIWIPTAPQTIRVEYLPEATNRPTEPRAWLDTGIDAYLMTSDTKIVHTAWSFNYVISEPKTYYERCMTPADPRDRDVMYRFGTTPPTGRGPQTMLKSLFNEAVVAVTANMTIDDVMTKQGEYRDRVFSHFSNSVIDMNIGVVIDSLTLDKVDPPAQTKAAFLETSSAGTTSDTYVAEANTYSIRTISQAEAQANQQIANAESYKLEVVSQLRSESIYFNSIHAEYEKSGQTILVALYNEVVGEALAGVRDKYLLGTGSGELKQLRMKLNPEIVQNPMQQASEAIRASAAAQEAAGN